MVRRDTAPVADSWALPEVGRYLAEVKTVEVKQSGRGDQYLSLRLVAPDFDGKTLCFDTVMLEGKGRGIGSAKLKALGIPEDEEEFNEHELVGQRVYIQLGKAEWQGEEKREVDIRADGSHCGYWPETENPGDLVPQPDPDAGKDVLDLTPDNDVDSTPF